MKSTRRPGQHALCHDIEVVRNLAMFKARVHARCAVSSSATTSGPFKDKRLLAKVVQSPIVSQQSGSLSRANVAERAYLQQPLLASTYQRSVSEGALAVLAVSECSSYTGVENSATRRTSSCMPCLLKIEAPT